MKRKTHRSLFIQSFGLFFIVLVTLIGAFQLDVVRQYISFATGTPADIRVDTQAVLGPMPRPWRNLSQGGEAFDWRLQPISSQVAALKPEYIRLDHIYDFYEIVGGSPGNLTFDFSKLDIMLNDIQAAGAKPFISLSYMPPVISQGDIVEQPINYADWQTVVQRTIQHVSGTRGIDDVYYEVWNEPDLFGNWKTYGSKNYLNLYTAAARGAANTTNTKTFKIGGPATTALYENWFNAVAQNAIDNNLRLDFISWHRYDYNLDQYRQDIFQARNWLAQFPQLDGVTELLITEWGHDSNNHEGYDNSLGAAHSVAGSIVMVGVLDKAFLFEIQDGADPNDQTYWGRWGLFTASNKGGQAKSRYWGLRMLDSLANQRLQTLGQGSFVKALAAKTDQGLTQVVLANYDRFGRHQEVVPITFENIAPGNYQVFSKHLSGKELYQNVATTAAELRTLIPLNANDVALIELKKIDL